MANDGRVCVVDFGLARAGSEDGAVATIRDKAPGAPDADPMPSPETADDRPAALLDTMPVNRLVALTATGVVVGTPAYMSPEQFEGRSIDERSDQFGFCVALYEALYGRRPFMASELGLLRTQIESGEFEPPPRDSKVPSWVWKALARGLAADPAERFPTIGELVKALARDPEKRRRTWILGATAGVITLVTGAAALQATSTGPEIEPCSRAGSTLAEVWNPAVRERMRAAFAATGLPFAADASTRVAARLDRYVDALASERIDACEAVHVRHEQSERIFELRSLCLDDRRRHLDAFLAEFGRQNAPAVEQSVQAVAELPRVEPCRDVEALEASFRPIEDDELRAEVSEIETRLAEASFQRLAGRGAEAMRTAQAQLERAEALGHAPIEARALSELGASWLAKGDPGSVINAESRLRAAADLAARTRLSELEADIWLRRMLLATRHHDDMTLAKKWAQRTIAVSRRVVDGGARLAEAMTYWGIVHYRAGDLERAEHFQSVGLELSASGATEPQVVSSQWHWLANTLEAAGRVQEARDAYEQSLAIHRVEYGAGHPRMARLLYDMGRLLRRAGEHDRARALLENALALRISVHGQRHLAVARTRHVLANLEQETSRLSQAEEHANASRDIYAQLLGPDDRRVASVDNLLGIIRFRQRRYEGALESYRRALAVQRRTLAPDNLSLLLTRSNVAEALVRLGRHDEALAILDEIEPSLRQREQRHPDLAALPLKTRGMALLGKNDPRGALAPLERAFELLREHPGSPLERADVQWALARTLRLLARKGATPDRALELARAAEATYAVQPAAGAREVDAIKAWMKSVRR